MEISKVIEYLKANPEMLQKISDIIPKELILGKFLN